MHESLDQSLDKYCNLRVQERQQSIASHVRLSNIYLTIPSRTLYQQQKTYQWPRKKSLLMMSSDPEGLLLSCPCKRYTITIDPSDYNDNAGYQPASISSCGIQKERVGRGSK